MKETDKPAEPLPALNTDRELWREREGDYYSDSIHVTEGGGIGMNCGGHVIVKPIREWFALAASTLPAGSTTDATQPEETAWEKLGQAEAERIDREIMQEIADKPAELVNCRTSRCRGQGDCGEAFTVHGIIHSCKYQDDHTGPHWCNCELLPAEPAKSVEYAGKPLTKEDALSWANINEYTITDVFNSMARFANDMLAEHTAELQRQFDSVQNNNVVINVALYKMQKRAEAAEAEAGRLNALPYMECSTCGYTICRSDWNSLRPLARAGQLRCLGCHGQETTWQEWPLTRLQKALTDSGSELCETREKLQAAEADVKRLRAIPTFQCLSCSHVFQYRDFTWIPGNVFIPFFCPECGRQMKHPAQLAHEGR